VCGPSTGRVVGRGSCDGGGGGAILARGGVCGGGVGRSGREPVCR
jgi:hypothetical protein